MTEQFMENISNEEHERLLLLCGHGIGAWLSPAAQAVLDAIWKELDYAPRSHAQIAAAAALRAAADQVAPEYYSCFTGHGEFDFGMDARNEAIREAILAIATELEGADG